MDSSQEPLSPHQLNQDNKEDHKRLVGGKYILKRKSFLFVPSQCKEDTPTKDSSQEPLSPPPLNQDNKEDHQRLVRGKYLLKR